MELSDPATGSPGGTGRVRSQGRKATELRALPQSLTALPLLLPCVAASCGFFFKS